MTTSVLYPYLTFRLACFALLLAGADLHSLIAQTSQVVKAGEKFTVTGGGVVYITSVLTPYSYLVGGVVHLGVTQLQGEIMLGVFSPQVISGPADFVPDIDCVITYYSVTATGFQSVASGQTNSPVIDIPAQTTCTFFKQIDGSVTAGDGVFAQVHVGGITMSNTFLRTPCQLAGPATVMLAPTLSPFIATFQMAPSRTNVVALQAGVKAITVEMSNDLIQWQAVFQTTNFLSTHGFFRLKAEN
jgi:hypothetical protein